LKSILPKGFSFVEIMAAMLIFGLFLVPMIPKFSEIRRQSVDAKRLVIAGSLASNKLEEMKLADSISQEILQPEVRNVHGIDFEIIPSSELIDPVSGFDRALPKVFAYKFKVRVKWARPGIKDFDQDFSLPAIVFRDRML